MSAERERIDLAGSAEREEWLRQLSCTEVELRAAIQAVGNRATSVRAFLQRERLRHALQAAGVRALDGGRSAAAGASVQSSLREALPSPVRGAAE